MNYLNKWNIKNTQNHILKEIIIKSINQKVKI
jgi:hypothetical protein